MSNIPNTRYRKKIIELQGKQSMFVKEQGR